MRSTSRRHFITSTTKFLGLGFIATIFGQQAKVALAADPALKLIDMSEKVRKDADNKQCVGIAKGIQYVEDLKKALAAGTTKKDARTVGAKTFKPEEQTCDNCIFFDQSKAGKDTCTLIPKCLVHKKGSCISWAPKA